MDFGLFMAKHSFQRKSYAGADYILTQFDFRQASDGSTNGAHERNFDVVDKTKSRDGGDFIEINGDWVSAFGTSDPVGASQTFLG